MSIRAQNESHFRIKSAKRGLVLRLLNYIEFFQYERGAGFYPAPLSVNKPGLQVESKPGLSRKWGQEEK